MTGAMGILDQIVGLKKKYSFRIFIDDAHGSAFWASTDAELPRNCTAWTASILTSARSRSRWPRIGGFIAGPRKIINYLRLNMRSQMYAKSQPMAFVYGNIKRLEIIMSPEGDGSARSAGT